MADKSKTAEDTGLMVGVCIRFCKDGQTKDVWVDLDKVSAIAWTQGEIKGRGANPNPGQNPIPKQNGPDNCPGLVAEDTQVCWWTGSAWACD